MLKAKKMYPFDPDFAIPPGETLKDVMASLGMSRKELADQTGWTTHIIDRILKGDQPITLEMANRLETTTGVPARLWNNLEVQYREQLEKLSSKSRIDVNQLGAISH